MGLTNNFFYNLGRKTGKSLKKGKWLYSAHFGTTAEAVRAEYAVGKDLADQMIDNNRLDGDAANTKLINGIAGQLISRVKNKERRFTFHVLDASDINAFALPGGFIFVTNRLMSRYHHNEQLLAFVLSHEMVHVVLGHPLKRIISDTSVQVLSKALRTSHPLGQLTKQAMIQLIQTHYSRDKELEADGYAVRLMNSAGFHAREAVRALDLLQKETSHQSPSFNYFSTHPPIDERKKQIITILNEL